MPAKLLDRSCQARATIPLHSNERSVVLPGTVDTNMVVVCISLVIFGANLIFL